MKKYNTPDFELINYSEDVLYQSAPSANDTTFSDPFDD